MESDHSSGTPCLAKKVDVREVLESEVVSEFSVENLIDDELKSCLKRIWSQLRDRIVMTPLESLSSLEKEIRSGLLHMKNLSDLEVSRLEDSIETLFSRAVSFDKARTASMVIRESSAQRLAKVKTSFQNAHAKEKKTTKRIASIRGELAMLEQQKEKLTSALQLDCASLEAICSEIEEFTREIKKLEDSPADGEVLENLKTSESLLRDAQRALEDQDPFA